MTPYTPYTQCDPGCPGWFPNGGDWGDIQRCDDCRRFANDDDAAAYADQQLYSALKSDAAGQRYRHLVRQYLPPDKGSDNE